MRPLTTWLAFLAAAFIWPLFGHLNAEDKLLSGERLGKITLGQKAEAVFQHLGKPDSKGKDTLWDATGEWVQEWRFPTHGLTLNMASGKKGGAKTVSSIIAAASCTLSTARGIKVGNSVANVRKAYGVVEEKTESEPGKSFVAGSIYGGVIFTLKGGRVTQIFLGAAAE